MGTKEIISNRIIRNSSGISMMASPSRVGVNDNSSKKYRLMAVLGSGGHTTEMLKMVESLSISYSPKIFVHAKSDQTTPKKLETLQHQDFQVHVIPRAREVGQSWMTTIFYTLYALFASISLVWEANPDL